MPDGLSSLGPIAHAEIDEALAQIQVPARIAERRQHCLHRHVNGGGEQLSLAREMVVKRLLGHAGAGRNPIDAGAVPFLQKGLVGGR